MPNFRSATGMIRNVPTADRPDFRVLGNPLKINGKRLEQVAAPTLGADNGRGAGAGARARA